MSRRSSSRSGPVFARAEQAPLSLQSCVPSRLQEPLVQVLISGVPLMLPELALHEGLSALRLSMWECASVADYAQGVGRVFSALERRGLLAVAVGAETR